MSRYFMKYVSYFMKYFLVQEYGRTMLRHVRQEIHGERNASYYRQIISRESKKARLAEAVTKSVVAIAVQ